MEVEPLFLWGWVLAGRDREEVPGALETFYILIWVGCSLVKIHQAFSYM